MGVASAFAGTIRAQRGALFGWVPVCLAFGIGGYFSLANEPSGMHLLALAMAAFVLAALAYVLTETARPFAVAALLICVGFNLHE